MSLKRVLEMRRALVTRNREVIVRSFLLLSREERERYYMRSVEILGGKYMPCPFGIKNRRLVILRKKRETYDK